MIKISIQSIRNLIDKYPLTSIVLSSFVIVVISATFVFSREISSKIAKLLSQDNQSPDTALTANVAFLSPTPSAISENDPLFIALKKSLPQFEDYPVKVYPIPPKPLVDHQSSPFGMRYWSYTENMASNSESHSSEGPRWIPRKEYDMAGHYLIDRYATGNPNVLIVDGLTGRVFHEYLSLGFITKLNSTLVISEPFDVDCFSSSGDYGDYGCNYVGNPRYVKWNGEQFIIICEPIVKNWKVVSCGKMTNKKSEQRM